MCKGISILKARLLQEVFDRHQLERRVIAQGGEPELHFMYTDPVVELPVIQDGQLVVMKWGNRGNRDKHNYRDEQNYRGNRRNQVCKLPETGWCRQESLEAGKWRWLSPEKVVIPADFGLEKGVWFQIIQGVHGVVVRDEQGRPHVYMLTSPASHYYSIMTKHDRMPVLVVLPHWFLVTIAATIAALPWIKWRFSLRTLLIVMTLLSLFFGTVAWSL